jgi:hypothetical protein
MTINPAQVTSDIICLTLESLRQSTAPEDVKISRAVAAGLKSPENVALCGQLVEHISHIQESCYGDGGFCFCQIMVLLSLGIVAGLRIAKRVDESDELERIALL